MSPDDKPRCISAWFVFWGGMSRDRGDPWPPQAGAGAVLARVKADFLDVLGGGGEQALACDGNQSSEAGVAVAVQLLGVGK